MLEVLSWAGIAISVTRYSPLLPPPPLNVGIGDVPLTIDGGFGNDEHRTVSVSEASDSTLLNDSVLDNGLLVPAGCNGGNGGGDIAVA